MKAASLFFLSRRWFLHYKCRRCAHVETHACRLHKKRVKAFADKVFGDMAGAMTSGLGFVGVKAAWGRQGQGAAARGGIYTF
jgi:hypothetical protein